MAMRAFLRPESGHRIQGLRRVESERAESEKESGERK